MPQASCSGSQQGLARWTPAAATTQPRPQQPPTCLPGLPCPIRRRFKGCCCSSVMAWGHSGTRTEEQPASELGGGPPARLQRCRRPLRLPVTRRHSLASGSQAGEDNAQRWRLGGRQGRLAATLVCNDGASAWCSFDTPDSAQDRRGPSRKLGLKAWCRGADRREQLMFLFLYAGAFKP